MLNKQTGNMYPFVTHTWNPIKGKCPHDCIYCYAKRFYNDDHPQPELHLDEKELNTNLGSGNFIFVGSSMDMWAAEVPDDWIYKTLEACGVYEINRYLFQTKNPIRFSQFSYFLPSYTLLGTTIETNKNDKCNLAKVPMPFARMICMRDLGDCPKMVSIEPIMDFDLDILVSWIADIKPEFVSIGADSKRHNLPEPPPDKTLKLIEELREITEVKLKSNLKRILKGELPE